LGVHISSDGFAPGFNGASAPISTRAADVVQKHIHPNLANRRNLKMREKQKPHVLDAGLLQLDAEAVGL